MQVQQLSGGELQRVALALCLGKVRISLLLCLSFRNETWWVIVQVANVYLIDEPSAYLDSEQRLHAAKVIKRYAIEDYTIM